MHSGKQRTQVTSQEAPVSRQPLSQSGKILQLHQAGGLFFFFFFPYLRVIPLQQQLATRGLRGAAIQRRDLQSQEAEAQTER